MNVLNAVPLMTTASSKATAFSLIIRMVLFPVMLLFGGPADLGGREGPAGLAHYMRTHAQLSISHGTENNSSPQSKKSIYGAGTIGAGWRA